MRDRPYILQTRPYQEESSCVTAVDRFRVKSAYSRDRD
jgi:hypothetical protein